MKRLMLLLLMLNFACKPGTIREVQTQDVVYQKPTGQIPPIREPVKAGFQNLDVIEDAILLDLQNLSSDRQRRDARYFIGCDRTNLGENVSEFEQGIDRGINQLSRERELHKITPIGPANCIYRIDLDAIGWTRFDWQTIEQNDVLFFVSKTIRNQNIQFLTQTQRPYLFGSSAMVTAYEGDNVANKNGAVYYKLVRQNPNTVLFLRDEGIDRQVEVNDENALFAGFSQSQIALGKTRMVSVYESNNGYCISTYDTKFGGDDLFTNPFTIELARAGQANNQQVTDKVFKHDAQEHICTLSNGLWGLYRLNGANDLAAAFAPNDVVININGAKIDPTIRMGDCSNCHYKDAAAIPFRDQLRAHIITNSAFGNQEKNLARIFFNYDQITAILDQLNRSHARALTTLGITAAQDPLWNVVVAPLRTEMTIDKVASYTILDTQTFTERLKGTAISSQVLGNLLTPGGTVSLATLSANYRTLVDEIQAFADENL